jgi:hypothetical protein
MLLVSRIRQQPSKTLGKTWGGWREEEEDFWRRLTSFSNMETFGAWNIMPLSDLSARNSESKVVEKGYRPCSSVGYLVLLFHQ